jgi:hypothetical protein
MRRGLVQLGRSSTPPACDNLATCLATHSRSIRRFGRGGQVGRAPPTAQRLARRDALCHGVTPGRVATTATATSLFTLNSDSMVTEESLDCFSALVWCVAFGGSGATLAACRVAPATDDAVVETQALRFPLEGGYVVVSQLVAEGQAIGTIVLGGATFQVSIAVGCLPDNP